jgi:hypothetical protein
MTEMIWYRHSETDAVVEQPLSAQPFLAQSGWFPLSAEDVAAREQAAADAVAADEKAMTDAAAGQVTGVPTVEVEQPARKRSTSEKGTK